MFFNSFEYLLFLPTVLAVYWLVSHRNQNILLLAASYFFYGCWDWRFLSLIIISTVVDFWAGRFIHAANAKGDTGFKRLGLLASVATNLSILGFFKYWDFFITEAYSLLESAGLSVSAPLLEVVLPVGISFYTFQTMSYTIDIYREKLEPTDRLLDFALFVAFFPQLVAGPIERARNLLPQISSERRFSFDQFSEGLWLILFGLIRKVVIADTAAGMVDMVFAGPADFGSADLALALALYSLQIYGDFSGYSNIARGSARLLGFDLMRNFNHPYFAASITEFWRRWHISLSTWLRDYLYIPLGGNRKGPRRTYVNLMTTMLLGGLWHGASWNFVVWGGLHGFYLAVDRFLTGNSRAKATSQRPVLSDLLKRFSVFLLVTFTWLFFRSTDWGSTVVFLQGLVALDTLTSKLWSSFLLLAALTLLIDVPQEIRDDEFCIRVEPVGLRAIVAAVGILLMLISGTEATPFIYFQF